MRGIIRFVVPLSFMLSMIWSAAPGRLQAITGAADGPRVWTAADGVHIAWRGVVQRDRHGEPVVPGWPSADIGGLRLPARLLAVRITTSGPVTPVIDELRSASFAGLPRTVTQPVPRTANGSMRPALARTEGASLPVSPVTLLRSGRMRGTSIAVLAISPVFADETGGQAATQFTATIPGTTLLTEDATALLSITEPFLASAAGPRTSSDTAAKILVERAGIQEITGAQLASSGIDLATLDPRRLHLRHEGTEIALEQRSARPDRLTTTDVLRFYAPPPGDRWNAATTYWLTVEAAPGVRMAGRSVVPGTAPVRTTALERGVWRDNQIYDSLLPGPDGDHWFSTDLRTGPGQPPALLPVPLRSTLPAATDALQLTVHGSAYTGGRHQLAATTGGQQATQSWSGTGDWSVTWTLTGPDRKQVSLSLVPGAQPDGIEPDYVDWERLVSLDFGGKGAVWSGVNGTWQYNLTNLPPDSTLYDISDPANPTVLTHPSAQIQFEDGPTVHQYVVAGSGTIHYPTVSAFASVDLQRPLNATLIYIAPAAFHAALAPLVAQREAQGHRVAVVDVQAIYDGWSWGQVDPRAIRTFLRYAASTWNPAPTTVVLVGDGTSDPRDYTGYHNPNIIPPYLAMVDPWLGETACDACYAQLDGDDPHTGPGADALPDLALGRLPVNGISELTDLVAKMLRYENAGRGTSWRNRMVFIADNADGAGDFAVLADQAVALQRPWVQAERLYYDPGAGPTSPAWRERDPLRAWQRTKEAIDNGAGVVTYIGHSQQWQWASTNPTTNPGYLLGLYDADALRNGDRLPVVLEMTCLTSAFQTPAPLPTTIDERLLLNRDGGAIAVWGPTGEGIAYGHDALQRGFYQELYKSPSSSTRLGTLTTAGSLELWSKSGCCQETLYTFALLGDPSTPLELAQPYRVHLPLVQR